VSWQPAEWAFNFVDGLTIPTFLNFGQGYAGARDEYVYNYYIQPQYGPGQSETADAFNGFDVHRPGTVYLSRVPRTRILDRDPYEFAAGSADGHPLWTSNIDEKKPVFTDDSGVGWNLSVSFNPGLQRYILCTEHSRTHRGCLGMFDAPEPWGPWTTIAYEQAWGEGHVPVNTFYWSIPVKWISDDGLEFTLLFTGPGENDAFNAVRGRFHRAPKDTDSSTATH
jgi:hypothetical protein